jgi:hypothetical protein
MSQVFGRSIALDIRGYSPKPDRRAIVQNERLAARAQPDEAALTGDFLVEATEVEHGIGLESVTLGEEGPGASLEGWCDW